MLRDFRGRPGEERLDAPHLTRLLGVVGRNMKRRSKIIQKSFRNYFAQFFTQVNIESPEVIKGQMTKMVFANNFELRKLAK